VAVHGSPRRWPTAGTSSRSNTGRSRRRAAGPRSGPGRDRRTPRSATPPISAGVRARSTCSPAQAAGPADPTSAAGGAGTAWPERRPTARRPPWSRWPPRGRADARRSRLELRFGVRALGELLQERVHFSRDLQRGARALQLGLERLVGPTQLVELDRL